MATNYTTGTINQPDAGSVGQAMIERIRDDLVAHAAWELVEEFTPGGAVLRWYVFKCLSAESELPNDFYVVFARRLSDGMLRMFICEEYTTGTHTAKFFAPYYYYGSGQQFDALGRLTTEYILGATDMAGSAGQPFSYYWAPGGTSTKWWLIVGDDFLTVAFNGANNGWMNAGAYTPLSTLPIELPIQAAATQGTNGASGTITRNPAAADLITSGSALLFQADVALGFAGDIRYNDKLQGGSRPVAELGMRILENNTGERAVYGNALGKLKYVRTSNGQVPAGMAFGDAYVLQGKLWVPYAPNDGRMWDTGVPSS